MILELPETDEAAALTYLAWLAYPGRHEAQRRDAFLKAACFLLYKYAAGVPRRDMPKALTDPGLGPKRMAQIVESGWRERIFHHRLAAVYAWLRMIETRRGVNNFTSGEGVIFNFNGTNSIEAASRIWADFLNNRIDEKDKEKVKLLTARNVTVGDFKKRTWRPTLPVLPMAISFCFSPATIATLTDRLIGGKDIDQDQIQMDGPISKGLTHCLTKPSWVRQAVDLVQASSDYRDKETFFPVFKKQTISAD